MSWSPRQRRKNAAIFGAASVGIRLGLALPRTWLEPTGAWLGLAAYALLDPQEDPARSLSVSAASEQVLAEALAGGRGVIYATCHLGPWERMAALLAQRGFPITTVARESYDPRFHALVYERLRAHRNVQAIYRGQPSAPIAMVRALRRGRVLGLLLDMPGRIATQGVNWLGLPSRMPVGAARLALRLRSPIVVGTPAPKSAGLEIRIAKLRTEDLVPGDRGEAELSQRIADALSERIRLLPTHWPWMHPTFVVATTAAVVLASADRDQQS